MSLLRKLILYLFVRHTPMLVPNKDTRPVLLFELGNLQVFCYQTAEQISRGDWPTNVYWQDKASRHTYGPFESINKAVSHYTWIISSQKTNARGSIGNVVYFDFKMKKRITIGGV